MSNTGKSWLLKVAPNKNRVYAVEDIAIDGRETYFFLLVEPAKEQAFSAAMEDGNLSDLTDFGRILASGYGKPSDELMARMRDEHGANT